MNPLHAMRITLGKLIQTAEELYLKNPGDEKALLLYDLLMDRDVQSMGVFIVMLLKDPIKLAADIEQAKAAGATVPYMQSLEAYVKGVSGHLRTMYNLDFEEPSPEVLTVEQFLNWHPNPVGQVIRVVALYEEDYASRGVQPGREGPVLAIDPDAEEMPLVMRHPNDYEVKLDWADEIQVIE